MKIQNLKIRKSTTLPVVFTKNMFEQNLLFENFSITLVIINLQFGVTFVSLGNTSQKRSKARFIHLQQNWCTICLKNTSTAQPNGSTEKMFIQEFSLDKLPNILVIIKILKRWRH